MARSTLAPAGVGRHKRPFGAQSESAYSRSVGFPRRRALGGRIGGLGMERRAIVRRPRSSSGAGSRSGPAAGSRSGSQPEVRGYAPYDAGRSSRTGGPQRGAKPPRQKKQRQTLRQDEAGRINRTRHGLLTRRPFRHYRGITLLWLVVFGVMAFQIFSLQVRNRTALVAQSKKQRTRTIVLAAGRGDLLDRFHVPLAISVREWRLIGDPRAAAADPVNTAEILAPAIGFNPEWIKARLARTGRYVVLARGLDDDMAKKIRALKLSAISLEQEQNRIYPSGDLARSV